MTTPLAIKTLAARLFALPGGGILRQLLMGSPRFDGRIRIYPTLRCNLQCDYCVNRHWPEAYKGDAYSTLAPEAWARALNRIGRDVVITGGEPFIYPGLEQLVNRLDDQLRVWIYTNFAAKRIPEIVESIARPVTFLGSYHPCSGPPEAFLETISQLRDMGRFDGVIHGVGTRDQARQLAGARRTFARAGWRFVIDLDQRVHGMGSKQEFRKTARCTRRIMLVAPDGTRYPCVSKLARRDTPLGNITTDDPEPECVTLTCRDYGYCAPCDGLGETTIVPLVD